MSTIAGLLGMLGDTQPRPWDVATRSQTEADTGLLRLADLKRQQAFEALLMERIKHDPALAQQLFGGSVLGSLGNAPGAPTGGPGGMPGAAPAPGPITQSPLGGGATQTIPPGQDLSRFANVPPQGGGPIPPNVMGQTMPTVTPPQSVLGSLGPAGGMPGAPQGPMQGPQNPLLEMARHDPRAAMMLQQQLEGRQDAAMKRQEQQLTMGTKIMDYLGRGAQGVTDQASLDAFREEVARVHPQAAASLPQSYSKEAMAPFIAKALDVKEAMTLQVQDLTAQAAVIRARKEGRSVDVDNQLGAMGVQPGQETPAQIKEALRLVQEGKKEVSASHGTGQIVMTPGGAIRVGKDNQVEVIKGPDGQPIYDKPTAAAEAAASYGDRAKRAHDNAVTLEEKGLTPSLWSKVGEALPFGLGNYLVGEDQRSYRQAVNQFGSALLRKESGAAISQTEYDMVDRTFFPQPNDSKKQIEAKRREREAIIKNLQEEGKGAGRTGSQAQPTSQAPAATGPFKPVGQMSREERAAERDALRRKAGM